MLIERQRLVSILSPDVIRVETLGERLTALDRRRRIEQIERWGVPVVDWDAAEPLQEALVRGADAVASTSVGDRQVAAAERAPIDEEEQADA
jgi:uncharacterized protein (DUF58 family)